MIPRKDHDYIINPYYIVYANDNYYLICNNNNYSNLSHYCIDKIKNITILQDKQRKNIGSTFDPYAYVKSKTYMYGGNEERITLKCNMIILDDMIDRFGNDVILQPMDDEHFLAIVNASRQGIIYLCLQYLRYCEVTSPQDLREEIKNILFTAIEKYDT